MNILYGYDDKYVDITDKVLEECIIDDEILIPKNDNNRADIFGDPFYGIKKNIKIIIDGIETIYNDDVEINIKTTSKATNKVSRKFLELEVLSPEKKLEVIHNNLKFIGGDIRDEYPEQLMVAEYLNSNAKVLELGSNVGRNTLTIASILYDETQFVTMECNKDTCSILNRNKNYNGFNFHIESSALSGKKLYLKGWDCFTEDNKPVDAIEVNTVTWQQLNDKYKIKFDTLVVDCEGALYNIFIDFPDMLENIHTVIMENDYRVLEHKQYVDKVLIKNGFNIKKQMPGGFEPCYHYFYQVWTKE
jgi:FkbM family methyltransferase